jgi:hypothetical protein
MEFIASPEAATQFCAFEIFLGFCDLKAALNDRLFIQVMAAPVPNSHDIVWLPVLMFILGCTFSPGAKIWKSLLQVANEAMQRFNSNCGSTARLTLNGVMLLVNADIWELDILVVSLFLVYLFGQYFCPLPSVQG